MDIFLSVVLLLVLGGAAGVAVLILWVRLVASGSLATRPRPAQSIPSGFFGWLKKILGGEPAPSMLTPAITFAPDSDQRLGADDWFIPALRSAIVDAQLDHDAIWPHREALRTAHDSNSPRDLDRALRPLLPAAMWPWPGYEQWAGMVGEKPTRLRMVAAVASLLLRRVHEQARAQQLVENADHRPYWQLRVVGDSMDWPQCKKLDGRIARWDSRFWQTHGPQQCSLVGCRCSIRAYTAEEAAAMKTKP